MRTFGLGTCLIAIMAISALLNDESGVEIWRALREDLSVSLARVAQLTKDNDEMRNEIRMLEAEPAAIDRAIREELDVALPGEIVVRFMAPVSSGNARSFVKADGSQIDRWILDEHPDQESR